MKKSKGWVTGFVSLLVVMVATFFAPIVSVQAVPPPAPKLIVPAGWKLLVSGSKAGKASGVVSKPIRFGVIAEMRPEASTNINAAYTWYAYYAEINGTTNVLLSETVSNPMTETQEQFVPQVEASLSDIQLNRIVYQQNIVSDANGTESVDNTSMKLRAVVIAPKNGQGTVTIQVPYEVWSTPTMTSGQLRFIRNSLGQKVTFRFPGDFRPVSPANPTEREVYFDPVLAGDKKPNIECVLNPARLSMSVEIKADPPIPE